MSKTTVVFCYTEAVLGLAAQCYNSIDSNGTEILAQSSCCFAMQIPSTFFFSSTGDKSELLCGSANLHRPAVKLAKWLTISQKFQP